MSMSRRAFLRGQSSSSEVHISSLVVHCRVDAISAVIEAINAMPGAEVPEHNEQGKLVVLLETSGQAGIMKHISEIETLPGVISPALVYHQIDNEEAEAPA
jgi:nitrate reductase NapD